MHIFTYSDHSLVIDRPVLASFFKVKLSTTYPLWLIQEEFQKREEANHFKIVDTLVSTLLRLGQAYKESIFREFRASINEAMRRILGDTPLKTPRKKNSLGGEKAYGERFNEYKSVCPFIVAFEYMKKQGSKHTSLLSLTTAEEIENFLTLSHWFHKTLSVLEVQNVKGNLFFPRGTLLSLPDWVTSDGLDVRIKPYQDIIDKLQAEADDPKNWINPAEEWKKKQMLKDMTN